MKKIYSVMLCISLILMNAMQVVAKENEENVDFELKIENAEIKVGEIQKVYVDFAEDYDVSKLDSDHSFVEIINDQNTRKVLGLVNDENGYYFQFVVDNSFVATQEWKIKATIQSQNEIMKGNDVSFTVLETEESKKTRNEDAITNDSAISTQEQIVESTYANSQLNIDNIQIVDGNGKYTVSANISANVVSVKYPTWTQFNGQDDILWKTAEIKNGEFQFTVEMKDHKNETGMYITHIYLYDSLGNLRVEVLNHEMQFQKPKIKNVDVQDENGKYTITADVEGYNLTKVQFPTWTQANGQDDIKWENGIIRNGKVSYTVEMKDHNYENGTYITHIYLYDAMGNKAVYGIDHTVQYQRPKIKNVDVQDENGKYTITADVEGYDLTKVQFPTWTQSNGQDDVKWENGVIRNGKVSYTVEMKDHNYETGTYITHIYLYDAMGNKAVYGIDHTMQYQRPKIKNVDVQDENGKYTITADAEGYDLTKVQFPTWTQANGQDDVKWENGIIRNGKVSYTVEMKDHKNEMGTYITHIYLYDAMGNKAVYGIDHTIQYQRPNIENVDVQVVAGKYTVTGKVSGYDIANVKMPTWTEKNGQDDVVWELATLNGNRFSYTADIKDHNYETGMYITHIYAYDQAGNYAVYGINQDVKNVAPVISNVQVSDITSQGYLITCTVTDDYALDKVLFPTWSAQNGQDDITWSKGTISGNKVSYRVYIKDHKYDFGEYLTHIYAYDKAGLFSVFAIPTVSINSYSTPGWKIVNGHKYLYDANGKIVGSGTLVIDISEHNGVIDWTAVKNAGVDGVILRSSYGYESNLSQMDKRFKENIAALNRLGIPYGIYHFSYARTSTSEGVDEARYVLKCLKEAGAKPSLPIYYDLEYTSYVGNKSGSFYAALTKNFASVIRGAGYNVGVYANYNWWTTKLTDKSFQSYSKWVAHYGTNANNTAATANPNWHPGSEYKMWQYSSCGTVKGINARVDMNILF